MPDYMSLRLAVDELTKPVTEWVKDSDGNKTLRTGEPLLEQLRKAINADTGEGGGKPARERTPINVGAFTLYEEIDGQVRAWMFDLGGRVGSKIAAGDVLRSWFVMFMGHASREQGIVDDYLQKALRWADRIRSQLMTPPPLEILAPCPTCEVEFTVTGHGESAARQRTIEVIARDPAEPSTWTVECKHCQACWQGITGMRELSWLQDELLARRRDEMEIAS